MKTYTYTSLQMVANITDIKAKVNVYGVVKFFKPPFKSRGTGKSALNDIIQVTI